VECALNAKAVNIIPLFIAVSLLLAGCQPGQPSISVDTLEFDFGDITLGEVVSRELVVSNTGTGTLVIDSLSTSCGCTKAVLDRMELPAGESAILHITYDSGSHGRVTGYVSRRVYIKSNDARHPELSIQFTANLISDVPE
jgi:hypothetical protein